MRRMFYYELVRSLFIHKLKQMESNRANETISSIDSFPFNECIHSAHTFLNVRGVFMVLRVNFPCPPPVPISKAYTCMTISHSINTDVYSSPAEKLDTPPYQRTHSISNPVCHQVDIPFDHLQFSPS